MDAPLEFEELDGDEELKKRIITFENDLNEAEKMLETFYSAYKYDDLSSEDKVRYNLFQAFAINSLFWAYLRTRGVDPGQHDIKAELNRVKEFMVKSKKVYERQKFMPRVDQDAAKRFIRSGLWTPDKEQQGNLKNQSAATSNKRKRDPDDDED